ncbi:MAG TPA: DUF1028 domain-containing protein [Verrucomicrobiales bacterium]|nr:DUF1028 domain-containing protein [Verrucomicrobiales bacterium]
MKSATLLTLIAISLILTGSECSQDLQPEFGVSSTFSIVAVDPETGVCGAAVASRYPDVGKVVPTYGPVSVLFALSIGTILPGVNGLSTYWKPAKDLRKFWACC